MLPSAPLDSRNLKSALGRSHPNPILMLCRWMIEQGFRSACRVDQHGMPSEVAIEAVAWIEQRLDWTRTGTIPPEQLRGEYVLSFEWCCEWLDLSADDVREHGLPPAVATITTRKKRWRTRRRRDYGLHARTHIYGLPHVHRIWAAAAQRHAAEIDAHECVDAAPLSDAINALLVNI